MAENKYSSNPIPDLETRWDGIDPSNGKEWSGDSVEALVRTEFYKRPTASHFDSSNYTLYFFKTEDDKSAWLDGGGEEYVLYSTPFTFTGVVNQLKIINGMESTNLSFTTTQEKAEITMSFLSQEKGITDTAWTEVMEDFLVTIAIDKGSTGSFEIIESNKQVLNGQSLTIDVKKYIATGSNRVRITAKGETTGATSNLIYSVNLTTMYLAPSNFAWNKAFVEGQNYSLGGLNIGGNIPKILKIRVTADGYERLYEENIGTSTYTTTSYFFGGLEFPTTGTGVYDFDIWLDASGLESEHLYYQILCVASADTANAQYVIVNDVADSVMNGADNKIFSYSIYNNGAALGSASVSISIGSEVLITDTLTDVATSAIHEYIANIEYESEASGLSVSASITSGNTETITLPLDNSASFPATTGASFYLNAATRNNSQANKNVIVNEVDDSEITTTWTDISYVDGMDGWTVDDEGRKCLLIPATSKAVVNYAPLGTYGTGKTIELAFKVANAADYTEDIIKFATTDEKFLGVKIKPTNITIHSNLLRENNVTQGYNIKDEEFVHVLITIVKNYKTNYGNLAQIYVNGVKKCSFAFSGTDSWINQSLIELGSQTADLYLYKMRVYEIGFGWQDATRNFISCLPDAESKQAADDLLMSVVDDSYKLNYEKIKDKYNTFVVEMLGNNILPSYQTKNKDYSAPCNFWIDIVGVDTPINGEFLNEEIEGQGTTSMNYWRWNLRSKTDAIRITAKKNYASSMHSHKMGATSLFNDLNRIVVGANEADGRVAVYQYPVYGFQKILVDGTTDQYIYEPIGLYTIGPDKGDKPTFGYNHATYKNTLIHMEGTDHSPKSVGMDYPWSGLTYSASVEALGVENASGTAIAAWEVGACMGLSPDETSDETAVMAALEQEFKPAYECDYKNTTMIVGVADTIDNINANLTTFRANVADNGFTYADCLIWLDGEYDTYYYNVISETYEKDGLNILTDLGISESDISGMTIEEKNNHFRSLRRARYKETMGNYWHLRDNLFHYCFIELFAATDNFKKNTYPYKFDTLANGSRWRWRQDDLDTLFDIDNQGLANKIYSILNGDTATGSTTHLFRGNSSYHWVLIKECYETEIKSMMVEIMEAMASLSPYGTSKIDKVIGCIKYYFWDKAQEYFPMSAYNADAEWSYEDAWVPYNEGVYQVSVHPLQQSLGSHYEAERAWVTYRMIFMASMCGFGAFAVDQSSDTSLGQISFRPAGENTFTFTPAIDLNPTVLIGASDVKSAGERVKAGDSASIVVSVGSDGDTSTYLQAADYMQDIGDLSKVSVNENNPSLNISSKRLQTLKVGDEVASNITTRLKTLGLGACPSLMEIEARNLSTLTGEIDLTRCPRLKRALFGGTSVSAIQLPNGSKVEELDLPSTLLNLSLVNLPKLTEEGLTYTDFTALTYLRVEGGNLEGFGLLKAAMNEAGSLQNIRVIGFDYDGDASDVDLLAELANGNYFGINENGEIDTTILPVLEGTLNIEGAIYEDTGNEVKANFPNITLNVSGGFYVRFADAVVQQIVADNWGDGVGITTEQIEAITDIGTTFTYNTEITLFDEFEKFKGVTSIPSQAFDGCENLQSISLKNIKNVPSYCFRRCNEITYKDYEQIENIGTYGFNAGVMTSLILNNVSTTAQNFLTNISTLEGLELNGVSEINIPNGCFNKLKSLSAEKLEILNCSFWYNSGLSVLNLPSLKTLSYKEGFASSSLTRFEAPSLTNLNNQQIFDYCSSLEYIDLRNVISIPFYCFRGCTSLRSVEMNAATSIKQGAFNGCSSLNRIIINVAIPPTLDNVNALSNTNNCPIYVPDASVEAYKSATNWVTYADRIMSMFYYLGYIDFADSAVRDICVANFDTDADGVISMEEAAAVTDIGTLFQNKTEVTSFDEFKYFTGVTALINNAFVNCRNLKTISLPQNVTAFGSQVFMGCQNLSNINFQMDLSSVTFGNKVFADCAIDYSESFRSMSTLSREMFLNCSSLSVFYTNLSDAPSNGTGYSVFKNCTALKKCSIAGAIASIGQKNTDNGTVFENCTSLETVIISSTIECKLCSYSFKKCTALLNLVLDSSYMMPLSVNGVFDNSAISNGAGYIYVPSDLVASYQADANWSTYANQIKPINVADTLPDISAVAENDLYKVGEVYWKAELVDSVLTWVEI